MKHAIESPSQPEYIRAMFGRIASAYDLTNDVLSLGIHKLWKRTLITELSVPPGSRVLDCATGTGDIAFGFESRLCEDTEIVGVDFSEGMLDVARLRAQKRRSRVSFERADVCALPFADATFDCASISFGIRNTRDPRLALREMARVVRPGGKIGVLEFGRPRNRTLQKFYRLYSKKLLPRLGGLLTGDPEAYRYLHESSWEFPDGQEFVDLALSTDAFVSVKQRNFQTGVAFLYLLEVRR